MTNPASLIMSADKKRYLMATFYRYMRKNHAILMDDGKPEGGKWACDWNQNIGENACPFISMYWGFLHRHGDKLQSNPRVAMMYRVWDRMKRDKRGSILNQANQYTTHLSDL